MSKAVFAYYSEQLLIHQGHKQWLWDHNNKRYLDLFAGIVTVSVGHCHPKVNAALEAQIKKLWHTTTIYYYPSIHEYTNKLLSKFPKELDTVIYTNSGSEANDMAMFISRLFTGKFDIISLRNGYHGMSPYTMGLTSLNTWKYNVANGFGVQPTMNPGKYRKKHVKIKNREFISVH
jgi:alanine-glyoxylate transaminase/(R)-3-amino-2-methylpropionate-pyruvate transaminase